MLYPRSWLSVVILCLSAGTAAAWETVGVGIEYQAFTAAGPNNLFVARMDRANTGAILESSIASGTISGATETIPNQAARYDEALNWWGQSWGQRNDVIVAINGDFFNTTTKVITGGQCHSGWYAKWFGDWGGYSGFGWTVNRSTFYGNCVYHQPANQEVTYPAHSNNQQRIHGVNLTATARTSLGTNKLIIYTPQYNTRTPSYSVGAEVLVEAVRPMVIIAYPNKVIGHVRAIYTASQNWIPFDHVVLSADGSAATTLLANVAVGDEIWISQIPTDYNEPDLCGQGGCAYGTGIDWQKTYASVGINYRFLENGVVRPPDSVCHTGYIGLTNLNPRTAIASNSSYVFYVVCDGRSTSSAGMGMVDLANFCKNVLGATDGANLDGGGSSIMVVKNASGGFDVKNDPSDGSPRAVANGMMMVNPLPKVQTTTFCPGQSVKTTASANVRLGPGTNYGTITTKTTNTVGTIVSHSLNGVLTRGFNWWKLDFGGTVGWVAESLLTPVNTPPIISAHPQPQTVCLGASVQFSVTACGAGAVTYQWQKNQSNLSNGGHYSGVTTAELTVSGCTAGEAGNYRCVVTNAYGNTNSYEAALTVNSPVQVSIGQPSATMTSGGPVSYTVTYTGADTVTLSAANVTLNKTGTANGTVQVSGSGNTGRTVTISDIAGDGTLGISLVDGTASVAGCGAALAAGPSATFLVDNTPPGAVVVTDEGTWTPSQTTLRAVWSASSDGSGSGVSRYEYAIGTGSTTQDIKGWTSVGTNLLVADSSLSLVDGETYYIQARAVDNVGLAGSGSSANGITVAPPIGPIGAAWSLGNSVGLSFRNKVVTAAFNGAFWLEEMDRSAAVKVVTELPVERGNTVSVAGVLGMSGPHRALMADLLDNYGGSATLPGPVALAQRHLGGASFNALTPGVTNGQGLYNTGLLVRCWGRVTYSDTSSPTDRYFYVDDGSGLSDGSHPGVRVRCGSVSPPISGMAIVTGIATSEQVGSDVVPAILIRDAADLVQL